jgi:N-acetylglucosaminyldiphosphoundecaprenol N-acetyl-beta-D-mannosaminyltransferase
VLGAEMDLIKPEEVFHYAKNVISSNGKAIVANHNLHSLTLIGRNPEMRAFFRKAALIEVDSLPLIFWARLIGQPSRRFHRCTYLDWRDDFWRVATANNWRVFFVGGREGVANLARAKIQESWPKAQLETHHGFFDIDPNSLDNRRIIKRIREFRPNVILVGMGMPRQEAWVLRNYDALPNSVVFTVGAAFDYEAGTQTPCPRWIGRIGLEWLFRLARDPRRLFGRYCIGPWRLAGPAMRDLRGVVMRRFQRASPRRRPDRPAFILGQFTVDDQRQAS